MSKDRFKEHLGDFLDAASDAGAALGHMAQDLVGIGREARAYGKARALEAQTGAAPAEEITVADAQDFMALALAEVKAEPTNLSQDGRVIGAVVSDFMAKHEGTAGVDLDGVYGPQSPDLMALYVREFQPGWLYTLGPASALWDNPGALPAGFALVRDAVRRGDIVVTQKTGREQFGNMGIALEHVWDEVNVLTQITGQGVGIVTYDHGDLRGFRWVGVAADA